ncbi:hypothetical protein ACLB2K_019443 [Fragaria x ananassa]
MANMRHRQWSDLPPELITTDIAERLGLLEVMRFRSVCQSWNSASSSTMSAKIESVLKYEIWFLHYGYDSAGQCQLVTAENGNITMNIPQLDESTTCIGSYQGWLLMFKQGGSMFFFHPFSKTKIDVPKFPNSDLTNQHFHLLPLLLIAQFVSSAVALAMSWSFIYFVEAAMNGTSSTSLTLHDPPLIQLNVLLIAK